MFDKLVVNVGEKTYFCEVPETEEEYRLGLSHRDHLAPDEGMLFGFRLDEVPEMWMKDTSIPLDMIGVVNHPKLMVGDDQITHLNGRFALTGRQLDDDGLVVKVETPEPNSTDLVVFPGCVWVLEVSAGSGIKAGDKFEIDQDDDLNKYTMKVLAPDGSTQAFLQGGERIFSRVSTRKIIKYAKKAYADRNDKKKYEADCKKLGEFMFSELTAQENRPAEYAEIKE